MSNQESQEQRPRQHVQEGERAGKSAAGDIAPVPNFVSSQPAGGAPPPDAPQAQAPAAQPQGSSEGGD